MTIKNLIASAKKKRLWSAEKSKLIYAWPLPTNKEITDKGFVLSRNIPSNQLVAIGPFLTAKSPQSHTGPFRFAIDFLVPDGTTVLTAQDGIIIELVECFQVWGDNPKYRDSLNFITIEHKNGEFTQYCHLAQNSASQLGLSIYNQVNQGQPIAVVGKTGWTDRDHLHFVVFRNDPNPRNPHRFKSVKPRFYKS